MSIIENNSHWAEFTLKEVAKYRRGSFPQPYGLPEWYDEKNGDPFVQVYDVDTNMRLKPETKQKISDAAKPSSVFVKKGTILLTIQGSIGRIAITQYDCYVDRTLLIFQEFIKPVDKVFFVNSLFRIFDREKQKAPGGTIKTITKEALSSFKISLPPIAEQKKIAEILGTCDRQIELTENLINAKRKLKQGLMQKLLTGKLRFPEFEGSEWKSMRLKDLGKCYSGGTPDSNNAEYWNGDIFWCTPTEITALATAYISSTGRKISKLGLKKSSAELLPINSVIVCTRATIGDCAINTVPMATNQGFKNIVPNEKVNFVFLYYLICSQKKQLLRRGAGSTFLEVSKTLFEKMTVFIPTSKDEQIKIADLLSSIDNEIAKLTNIKTSLTEQKKGLMQQLLTGKTRVKVD